MKIGWDPFAGLLEDQVRLIEEYERLLVEKNRLLNLISRPSEAEVRVRHIEHSLTLALRAFPDGSSVVDWGTGGGLPGIPLAIRFSNVRFHLVDSILKKVRALESIVRALGLENVVVHRMRAEDWTTPVDYAVSRATDSLTALWRWTEPVLSSEAAGRPEHWSPGLIALKGGDLSVEIAKLDRQSPRTTVECIELAQATGRSEYTDKYIVCVRRAP